MVEDTFDYQSEIDGASSDDDALVISDGSQVVGYESFDGMDLKELEDMSFAFAAEAGRNEVAMWLTLAYIREYDLWVKSGEFSYTWRNYLADWLLEAAIRCESVPWSISVAQKRLSSHRRLCDYFQCEPDTVLSASLNVMTRFMDALSPDGYDYKTGEPTEISQYAIDGLNRNFPDTPLHEQVNMAVGALAHMKPSDALAEIKDSYMPPSTESTEYEWRVVLGQDGAPGITCLVTKFTNGLMTESTWYGGSGGPKWPMDVIKALSKKLGAVLVDS